MKTLSLIRLIRCQKIVLKISPVFEFFELAVMGSRNINMSNSGVCHIAWNLKCYLKKFAIIHEMSLIMPIYHANIYMMWKGVRDHEHPVYYLWGFKNVVFLLTLFFLYIGPNLIVKHLGTRTINFSIARVLCLKNLKSEDWKSKIESKSLRLKETRRIILNILSQKTGQISFFHMNLNFPQQIFNLILTVIFKKWNRNTKNEIYKSESIP